MSKFDGKVAFVTGAARGQGRNHAISLAREGADIIAVDICRQVSTVDYPLARSQDLKETVRLVEQCGSRIVHGEVDIRDLDGLTSFVDAAVKDLGRLDIIVANAGIHSSGAVLELTEQKWQDVIDVNLTGCWKTIKASARHVVEGGRGGSIVLTSSAAAQRPLANNGHYSASKSGLTMLMKVLALELAEHNVRVNTLHPTTVTTDMVLNDSVFKLFRPDLESPTRSDWEEAASKMFRFPISGGIHVDDVTEALMYLVSDSGRYVTGTEMFIDAGTRL